MRERQEFRLIAEQWSRYEWSYAAILLPFAALNILFYVTTQNWAEHAQWLLAKIVFALFVLMYVVVELQLRRSVLGKIASRRTAIETVDRLTDHHLKVHELLALFIEAPCSFASWPFIFSRCYSPEQGAHNACVLRRLLSIGVPAEEIGPISRAMRRFEEISDGSYDGFLSFDEYRKIHSSLARLIRIGGSSTRT